MHFLCSTYGSSGDVFPMLGLAIELQCRGHQVTLATNEYYAALAAKHGVPFVSLGTKEEFNAAIRHPDLWHPTRAFPHVFNSLRPTLKQQYELYADHARRGGTIGITSCFGFGAFLVRDKFKMPVVTMHCQPAVIWSDYEPPALAGVTGPRWLRRILYRIGEKFFLDPVVCPFINAWRSELGLPPMRQLMRWWNSPDGVLCLFPDWFSPPQPDWPPGIMQTDFPLWNDSSNQPLGADVQKFLDAGEPPIVFTPGSTNLHGERFFDAAARACQKLGRRAIFLTEFREQLPNPLPSHVQHFQYVPLDLLLPRSAAFVHHGGIGSTSQGMLAGIPQVLMMLAHDQFDNGERVRRLGVGDSIAAPKFTERRLVTALQQLLENPRVTAACQQATAKLAARNGLQRSADALEARFNCRN